MKATIMLVFVYFLLQLFGALAAAPIGIAYTYFTLGVLDVEQAQQGILPLAMLLGFLFMGVFLWRGHYLKGDKHLYSFLTLPILVWSLLAGFSAVFLNEFLMEHLSLPNWMDSTFDLLQTEWLGILCISLLGPILEELLFRGAITRILLQRYKPVWAIVISGLVFGLVHINPVQVVSASLIGFLFAWLYYKTRSLVPGILIHILNNSLSVWLNQSYKDVDNLSQLMDGPYYTVCLVVAVLLLLLSLKILNAYRISDVNTTSNITTL